MHKSIVQFQDLFCCVCAVAAPAWLHRQFHLVVEFAGHRALTGHGVDMVEGVHQQGTTVALSGIGGGLMRDLLAGDTPELLRPGQYNTLLVILSALLYMGLVEYTPLSRTLAAWTTIALFFMARLLTIRFNWRTRPLSDFHVTEMVGGMSEWLPWRKKP